MSDLFLIGTDTQIRSLENPAVPISQAYDYLVSNQSTSGVAVNRQNALSLAPLYRALDLVSKTIAKLPLPTYRQQTNGGKQLDKLAPSYKLLMRRPSRRYTPLVFKQMMQFNTMYHGNGYALIMRNAAGEPAALIALDPMGVDPYLDAGDVWYKVYAGRTEYRVSAENMLHIRGLGGFDYGLEEGLAGYSILHILRDALGWGLSLQSYANSYFKNGCRPSAVIEFPGAFKSEEALSRFRKGIESHHSGANNGHKVMLLENGAKFSGQQIDNESAQFLESQEFFLKTIANITGVPPHKLGSAANTSYKSLYEENRAFLNDIGHWLTAWEEEVSYKLLSTQQFETESHIIHFDRTALERPDRATQVSTLIAGVNNGLFSLEEARTELNLPITTDGTFRRPNNVQIEGEPEPAPQPPVQAQPPASQETDTTDDQDTARKLRSLVRTTVGRLVTRLQKAEATAETVRADHGYVIGEALAAITDQEHAVDVFATNIDTLDIDTITEQLGV